MQEGKEWTFLVEILVFSASFPSCENQGPYLWSSIFFFQKQESIVKETSAANLSVPHDLTQPVGYHVGNISLKKPPYLQQSLSVTTGVNVEDELSQQRIRSETNSTLCQEKVEIGRSKSTVETHSRCEGALIRIRNQSYFSRLKRPLSQRRLVKLLQNKIGNWKSFSNLCK